MSHARGSDLGCTGLRGGGKLNRGPRSVLPVRGALAALAVLLFPWSPAAAAPTGLENLTLEELMQIEVTSVAGVAEDRFTTPSAIYVITPEDLRHTGIRTLPEALRLVPGMFVGRGATSNWVIGARGLTGNGVTTTRTLVLIDGRVAYDPLFNGSPWDVLDYPLDDVERIEVIRGPGATLWGVNAVNGVINVITKSARDTPGGHVRVSTGTVDDVDAMLRYGGEVGRGAWRVWGRYADTSSFDFLDGGSANDDWTRGQAGFRLDFGSAEATSWTVQGGRYDYPTQSTTVRQPVPGAHIQFEQLVTDDDLDGGHLMVAAQRGVGEARGFSARAYFDRSERDTSRIGIHRDTFDVDFRSWRSWKDGRRELLFGAEAFVTSDEIRNGPTFIFDPTSRSWTVFNAFVQYTTELVPDRWHVLAGTKLTQHEFVGFEAQPSVRVSFTPNETNTLWAGVSRPVRVPSRLEEQGFIVVAYADPGILAGGPPTGVVPFGVGPNAELDAEEMLAYELGYRVRPHETWEIDVSAYYDDFSTLIGIVSPLEPWSDGGTAEVWGIDVSSFWKPAPRFVLEGSYSFIDVGIGGTIQPAEENATPRNLAQLRSTWGMNGQLELSGALYYVDELEAQGVDAYERLDVGLTWSPWKQVELALWGQNLLDEEHAEASNVAIPRGAQFTATFGW